jgi:hypothetical protein
MTEAEPVSKRWDCSFNQNRCDRNAPHMCQFNLQLLFLLQCEELRRKMWPIGRPVEALATWTTDMPPGLWRRRLTVAQRPILRNYWGKSLRHLRGIRERERRDESNEPKYLWPYSHLLDPVLFFSFLIFYTVGRTPRTGDQPVSKSLSTHRTTQTQNKRTQTSMPRVGFEPTIPAFERVKTVHSTDRAATAIGVSESSLF